MSKVEIRVEVPFSAAHRLPYYDGPCFRLHGHNYKLIVRVAGPIDERTGFVMDFEDLRKLVWDKAIERCDHHNLNDFLDNPTAENIVVWIWQQLAPSLPGLLELELYETPEYSAVYRGEG